MVSQAYRAFLLQLQLLTSSFSTLSTLKKQHCTRFPKNTSQGENKTWQSKCTYFPCATSLWEKASFSFSWPVACNMSRITFSHAFLIQSHLSDFAHPVSSLQSLQTGYWKALHKLQSGSHTLWSHQLLRLATQRDSTICKKYQR